MPPPAHGPEGPEPATRSPSPPRLAASLPHPSAGERSGSRSNGLLRYVIRVAGLPMMGLERHDDLGRRVAVAVQRRARAVPVHEGRISERGGDGLRIGADDPVPAGSDGL